MTVTRTRSTLALLLCVVLVSGCAGSKVLSGEALETHLAERLDMFGEAFNGTSVDAIMAFFAAEPEVIPDGQSMKGTPSVRNVMQQSIANTSDLTLSIRDVTEGERTFEQRGRYLLQDGSVIGQSGSFTANWTHDESGAWLLSRLAWTAD